MSLEINGQTQYYQANLAYCHTRLVRVCVRVCVCVRSEVGSPTQWAERAEQEARGRLQPLLNQALVKQTFQLSSQKIKACMHTKNRL